MEINIFDPSVASSAVRVPVSAWSVAHPVGVGALSMQAQKLSVLTYGAAAELAIEGLLISPFEPVAREKSALIVSAARGVDQVPAPQQTEAQQCTTSNKGTTSSKGTTSGVPPRGRPV